LREHGVITARRLRQIIENYYPEVQPFDGAGAAAFRDPFAFLVHEMWKRDKAAACPAHGWQPIETAPKDGGKLGLCPTILLGFKADEEGCAPPSREGYWSLSLLMWVSTLDPTWSSGPQPTHWMPLPEPPA
jgi:hypothetical protein